MTEETPVRSAHRGSPNVWRCFRPFHCTAAYDCRSQCCAGQIVCRNDSVSTGSYHSIIWNTYTIKHMHPTEVFNRARELRAAGLSFGRIANEMNLAVSLVHRWCRDVPCPAVPASTRPPRREHRHHDWAAIQAYVDKTSCSQTALCREFDLELSVLQYAIQRGRVAIRDHTPLAALTKKRAHRVNGTYAKRLLLATGVLTEVCEKCGQGTTWQGKPLMLQLDHRDGNCHNNAVTNLRLLCPNCHTQTPTYAGRSIRRQLTRT